MRSSHFLFGAICAAFGLAQPVSGANIVEPDKRWPGHTIEVIICDAEVSRRSSRLCARQKGATKFVPRRLRTTEAVTIRRAIHHWNSLFRGSLRFKEVSEATGPDAIVFRVSSRKSRCSTSHVGYSSAKPINFISVGSACNAKKDKTRTSKGTILHEMMHAVGVYHEQERPDRAEIITIAASERARARWGLACKRKVSRCDKGARGIPFGDYDLSSIMHYSFEGRRGVESDLTAEGLALAASKSVNIAHIGQRQRLTEGDVAGVQALYSD